MSDAVTGTGTRFQETKAYKAAAYVAGVLLAALFAALSDSEITRPEWGQLLVAAIGGYVVWSTTNLPRFRYLKQVNALLITLAALGASFITGAEITSAEWLNLAAIGAGFIGVVVIPNPPKAVQGEVVA